MRSVLLLALAAAPLAAGAQTADPYGPYDAYGRHQAVPITRTPAADRAAAPDAAGDEAREIERRLVAIGDEIVRIDQELDGVRSGLGRTGAFERRLDADREAFQDRIRAFNRDRTRYQIEAGRVRAMYDDLVTYGASGPDRERYERAVADLQAESDRLQAEAAALNAENAGLNAGYGRFERDVRGTAGRGRDLAERRTVLVRERDALRARYDRLRARER